ncbi:MAG TPA: carboxypeptidase regulatory-like domain-containing protein, partial [Nitrolancea sp.]|nr:carboxypeptidase regulatory-like domain-containing protein [Nitrolancea sp.]
MKRTTPSRIFRCATTLCAAFVWLAGAAFAQTAGTGTIVGRVLNAASGSYLNNAHVTVEGTQLETFTNGYGEYRLDGVPAGTAKVHVFYTGQAEQVLSVDVVAGQAATQDVSFGAKAASDVVKLDQFVVASQKDTDQKSIAINEQRFSPILKSVVSTDQFGDVTEGNVGEFLKYMPGISLEYTSPDARQIIIRGVNPVYTAVFVDGNR